MSIFPINKIRNSNFIDQNFIAEKLVKEYSDKTAEVKNKKDDNKDLIEIKNDDLSETSEEDKIKLKNIIKSDLSTI